MWIEIDLADEYNNGVDESHPSRDVWIEIRVLMNSSAGVVVTSLAGCVD